MSKLSLVNYRNFAATTLEFNAGVNTVIGENGAGKSNLFRAVRLLLDANMLPSVYRLDEEDFHRPLGEWRGHWIVISLEFDEVSEDESIQALFLHGVGIAGQGSIERATYNLIFRPRHATRAALSQLTPGDTAGLAAIRKAMTIADYEAIFTGRSTGDFTDPEFYKAVVGDFDKAIFQRNSLMRRSGQRCRSSCQSLRKSRSLSSPPFETWFETSRKTALILSVISSRPRAAKLTSTPSKRSPAKSLT